ncbi:MAG: DNA-directed RNA polymerase subunit alpha [Deltaproteobacteria bacterium]|nr:DNA-directed RNA polymerase subunit alpha [Deltaproteobacteria bacterium]
MQPQRNWRDLLKPKKLEADEKTLTATYGKFVGEPFERGFGITIGNALRRVLLSSLQSAAISAVRIKGVLHEFSTVPGVLEDVTDIVLNLKEVRLRLHDGLQENARIEAKGPGEIKAGDIQGGPNLEVLNPALHIATLSKEGKLDMDLSVRTGRGYVAAERNKEEDAPVGTIPIDAVFSPVRKVNYTVTNARVGQRTDYDKLTLEIWTDGSVRPDDAVAYAARILQDQLGVFVNFEESTEMAEVSEERQPSLNENLFRSVAELELSVRAANCLQNADIKYIGELVRKSEGEMLKTKNFGRKSLNEIKEILHEMGLDFGMRIENFPPREELDRRMAKERESV